MSKILKAFECHGVSLTGESGTQAIGNCPFCDKEGRFYVHKEKGLWDCKKCGKKGNLYGFLGEIARKNGARFANEPAARLSRDRRLPLNAFRGWEVGWNGSFYTIPVKDYASRCRDIRCYTIGNKTRATSGAALGLLGAERLQATPGTPVYVCEGEWDALAFEWLRSKLGKEGVTVAVPGASVFKDEWIPWFQDRDVVLLYDHDSPGSAGRDLAGGKLKGVARSIKTVDWIPSLPDGFDVRDFVVEGALRRKTPRACWKKLGSLLTPFGGINENRSGMERRTDAPSGTPETNGVVKPEEVAKMYRKWLHLPSDEVLRVLFGAVHANKMQGDPIWLFLVAPPGGSKSELLSSLSRSPLVESTTSLTPHSLVSGASFNNGVDPSLLPKLNGRILVIKDFTTILSMHYTSRDEIFAVLRDAYDGKTEKTFGTGVKRSYVSHFGIIAGVTPKIEEFGVLHQSLGERFLKYRINMGERNISETDRIRRAIDNINREGAMRDDLSAVATTCMAVPLPKNLPVLPRTISEYIIHLAQTCAMMRGVVERDRFSQNVVYKPSIEVGTRLAKQLIKLSMGIAMYLRRSEVDLEIFRTIRRVALDTAPDRIEEIVRQIWYRTNSDPDLALKTNEVSAATRLPAPTCFRVLTDLELLRLVDRLGQGNKYEWRLNAKLATLIKEGLVYERRLGRDPV